MEHFHTPVMVKEVIGYLLPANNFSVIDNKSPMIIDATVGGGGHSQAILEKLTNGIVVGLDCDADAIEYTKQRLAQYSNFYLFNSSYTDIDQIVENFPDYYVQGILFDLGVSYYQVATPSRGFSYLSNGPLDMRFNQDKPSRTAQDIIQHSSLKDLKRIFSTYGEERFANRIAVKVYHHRTQINSTLKLVEIIRQVIPAYKLNKILARIFQSLRIVVNNELANLKVGLKKAIELLFRGARIVVISYHSLEDRIVKQTFRDAANKKLLRILTKKPNRPTLLEIKRNPSARSARLRAAERI